LLYPAELRAQLAGNITDFRFE
jgi:hypothetical protein